MTFPTTGTAPRIGAGTPAITSLGAVGGARGAGAGALRIFVEFLSTYDSKATKQLQDELRQIDHAANNSAIAEEKRLNKLLQVRGKLAEAEKLIVGALDTAQRRQLKQFEALSTSRSKAHREEAAAIRTQLVGELRAVGLRKDEIDIILNRVRLKKDEELLVQRQAKGEATQARLAKERLAVEEKIARIQQARANLTPKIQALALGLIGGFAGAAIFTGIAAVVDLMVERLQNIIDPAKRAREELEKVVEAIREIQEQGNLDTLEATAKYLEQIGLQADAATTSLIAFAVTQARVTELLKQQEQATNIAARAEQTANEQRKLAAQILLNQRLATDEAFRSTYDLLNLLTLGSTELQAIAALKDSAAAAEILAQAEIFATNEAYKLRAAQEAMAVSAAQSALANEALAAALARQQAATIGPIQARLDNLSVQPSRRTRRLERAVERAGSGGGSGVGSQLANIAEERQLILLRQRLRLMGTAINLERYSGKFLLEAINAKIAALEKENREQDRLNRLLDLQYRMSQTIRRSQGESIGDFLARRAQENRQLLAEQDDLDRQRRIDRLNDLRDKVQDEVALAELAEQRKNAIASAGSNARLKGLQKELAASKKADQEAYEAKKKALQKQIEAEQRKNKELENLMQDSVIEQTRTAIRGASSLQQLAQIAGRIQGYKQARATIQGLVEGFGLPKFIAAPFLERINALISAYERKLRDLQLPRPIPGRTVAPLQHGGVMLLNNSFTGFGQNVQTGEGGTELGVVLSHKVADILQKQKSPQQIGPFNIYGTEDPYRDRYKFAKSVREAVSEALA